LINGTFSTNRQYRPGNEVDRFGETTSIVTIQQLITKSTTVLMPLDEQQEINEGPKYTTINTNKNTQPVG